MIIQSVVSSAVCRLSPLCVLLLMACATPQWQAPPIDLPQQWQAAKTENLAQIASDQLFWQGFADPQLLALQATARERNSDIALAALRLRKAGFVITQRQLDRTPNLSANVNGGASWQLDPSRYRGDNYGANLGVSWELDLWGKLADQQQAARWRETASAADLAAMQQSIVASVASTYWAIAREQDTLQLAKDELQRAKDTQIIVERRYRAGVVSGLDLTQARSSTLQQENQLSQAQLSLAKSQWQLGLLLDQPPQSTLGTVAVLPRQYPEIAAGIPADMLNRRPDLAAATARLQASFTDQQVTRKSWYPSLSLTGGLGTSSQDLLNLLSNPVATLGAGLSLPFIRFNEMELANKTSAADYEQTVIEYRQKLYGALQEVEVALATMAHLKAELPRMQALADETKRAEQQTQLRYQAGAMAFDSVLSARTRRQAADHALVLYRYQLAVASVEVYKALGGAPETPRTTP